jgi:CHAT domain-containing protein/Tfp pilus assembly protein PilF
VCAKPLQLLLAGALALLSACSQATEDPSAAFRHATQVFREGRSAEAVTLAHAGAEQAAGLPDPTWRWRFRQLEVESRLYGLQPKEAEALLQEPLPAGPAFEKLRPRQEYLGAYAKILGGQAEAGLSALPDIAERAQALGLLDVALDALVLQAQTLLRRGKFDVADGMLLDALSRTSDAVAHQRGLILLNLGMSRLVRNRFDEALLYFERVLGDRSIESTLIYRAALGNAGICYSRLGDIDRAIALQRRAVEGHERTGLNQYIQQALGELSGTYLLSGNMKEAVSGLQRALDIATANRFTADAVVWANNLAIAYGDAGDWDRAEHFNEIALKLRTDARASSLPYNIYSRARIAAGRGQISEAIAGFEEAIRGSDKDPYAAWVSQAGLAQVYRRSGRMPDAIKHYEEALGIIEHTRAELISREYRLTFLSRLIRFHQDYVDALVEDGDVERALEVAESSRARVLAERQGVARTARVAAGEFVKLARRTDSVLLSYWLAPTRSFVWVITSDGIRCVTLPSRQEIEPLVRGYRNFVTVSLADPLAAGSSPGTRLSETLLAPVLDAIPSGTSVVIVPDDALHSLSFDMLPLPSPQPHYWIEDVTVTLAPSLALAAESQTRRAPAQPSLLLIGDPTHVDTALPALTFAGTELSGIERAFGGQTRILRGADATPGAVTSAHPERFSLIHFAAHATASAESPLESAILLSPEPLAPGPKPQAPSLSPYKLYARDVTGLPLAADVVTLSACRSAGGRAYGGEGLVGFAWAFLRAGARQVVAGLWDVDDQSTALLMERFYGRLGAGAAPATALRDAKLSLLKSGGNFRKPYYWAAFAVFSSSLDPS